MDKTVMIAGVIAIVAILTITLTLNPFGSSSSPVDGGGDTSDSTPQTTPTTPQQTGTSDDDRPPITHTNDPDINYEDATYGVILEELEGNCTLYQHVVTEKLDCFGTAGEYYTLVTNEYKKAESEEYFCKATKYGCKLYQKVEYILA